VLLEIEDNIGPDCRHCKNGERAFATHTHQSLVEPEEQQYK